MEPQQKMRILTGMRPTGRLHLGHYCGALKIWLPYNSQPEQYENYFLIADYQALGDNAKDVSKIRDSVIQVTIDWLSVGLNPETSNFVVQSYVPEHAELSMLLSTITPQTWLDSNPTLKDESPRLNDEQRTVGFMTYPMSQVADILLPMAHLVPAGQDQASHIEFTRRVARKFNKLYGNVFPSPKIELSEIPRLVGTDGNTKMGKSTNNAIFLSDTAEVVSKKVRSMVTDSNRVNASTPGSTENNVPFIYLDIFDKDKSELSEIKDQYRKGKIGDMVVKERLSNILNDFLDPIRNRRAYFESKQDEIQDILQTGSSRAQVTAQETMKRVKEAMGISKYGA